MRRAISSSSLVALLSAAPAEAQVFAPPEGKVFTGLTGSNSVEKLAGEVGSAPRCSASSRTGTRPTSTRSASPSKAGARLMLHVSTARLRRRGGDLAARIARGQGDAYLLKLNARIAEADEPVYVRLMAEMNNTNNVVLRVQRRRLLARALRTPPRPSRTRGGAPR